MATARSFEGGSFGGSYNLTTVQLKMVRGSQPAAQVLLFSHEYATMNLKMDWVSPKHLAVSYAATTRPNDHVELEFEAIKCAGIDISIRDVSGESAKK